MSYTRSDMEAAFDAGRVAILDREWAARFPTFDTWLASVGLLLEEPIPPPPPNEGRTIRGNKPRWWQR